MASGEERSMPEFFEITGTEFIWRLRTDTKRRLKDYFPLLLIIF